MSFIGPALESAGAEFLEAVEGYVANEVKMVEEKALEVLQHDVIQPIEDKLQTKIHDYLRPNKKRKFINEFTPASTMAPTLQRNDTATFRQRHIPFIKPLDTSGKNSFAKILMAYKRRYPWRRRRRYKRRKYTTKRSVKSLIARHASSAGSSCINQYSISQTATSALGIVARQSQYFNTYTDLTNYVSVLVNTQGSTAIGGADQPRAGNYKFKCFNFYVETLIHSAINEYQFVNCWLLENRAMDDTSGPVGRWNTEYDERMAASTAITGALCPFNQNYMTYPTEFAQWKRHWKIKKKWKFQLAPGQTAKLKYKCKPFTCTMNDLISTDSLQPGITHAFMIELKGVPTHQNNAGSQVLGDINRSLTGVDIIHDIRMNLAKITNLHDYINSVNLRETVAQAQSIVASAPLAMQLA